MADIDKLNFDEQKAVEDLRTRMKNFLSPEMYDDSILFYRFLKARNFDVEKAEGMLKKHLKWRKVFQVDSILKTLKLQEVFVKYLSPQFIGFDKDGDIIIYASWGKLDAREIFKSMKMNDIEKHYIYISEETTALLRKENEKNGRNRYQAVCIVDLDQLTIANATNKASLEFLIRLSLLLQDNYPENLKAAFVINDGWKEALLERIDASVLPTFLGGNRTDPDGNPLCLTFMIHGGKIPERYHLTNDERWFKDMSLVQKIIVPPLSKTTVCVAVKQHGSWIHWKFECKPKDIEFGLFFQDNEHEIEVLPMHMFTTSDGTETGSFKTESAGKYVIIFGNSHSWLRSKEVYYVINVVNPDL